MKIRTAYDRHPDYCVAQLDVGTGDAPDLRPLRERRGKLRHYFVYRCQGAGSEF